MSLNPVVETVTEDNKEQIQEIRAERYNLQSVARTLLIGQGLKMGFEYAHNYHRTAKCTHVMHVDNVSVFNSKKFNKSFYGGLVTCGNVWACPVCAAKVEERRRVEIAKAFDWAYDNDKKIIMVTFTFSHSIKQSLDSLLSSQADAFKKFRSGKAFSKVKDKMGFTGLIRSLEITYGANGWHPHTHEAWIVDKTVNTYELREVLANRWFNICSKVGLVSDKRKKSSFLKRSVQITDWCQTSDYLAKNDSSKHWGADRELAKASTKKGRSKGFHPFGLLAEYDNYIEKSIYSIPDSSLDYLKDSKGKRFFAEKFLEYVTAVKGKRRIYWSQGLKDLVGVNDKTDIELATEQEEKADLLKLLTREQWRIVIDKKLKTKLLDSAENGTIDEFCEYYLTVISYSNSNHDPTFDHSDPFKDLEQLIIKSARSASHVNFLNGLV